MAKFVSSMFGGGQSKATKKAAADAAKAAADAARDREIGRLAQERQAESQRATAQDYAQRAGAAGRRPRGSRLLLSAESGGLSSTLGGA